MWKEIPKATWKENEYGVLTMSRRSNLTRYGQFILPTIYRLVQPWPNGRFKWPRWSIICKTPVDDTHTLMLSTIFTPFKDGRPPELPSGLTFDITEELHGHRMQDYEVIMSQGPIVDRSLERLGTSDDGIAMLRKVIQEAIDATRNGRDPKGVWRSPDMDRVLDFSQLVIDSSMESLAA